MVLTVDLPAGFQRPPEYCSELTDQVDLGKSTISHTVLWDHCLQPLETASSRLLVSTARVRDRSNPFRSIFSAAHLQGSAAFANE